MLPQTALIKWKKKKSRLTEARAIDISKLENEIEWLYISGDIPVRKMWGKQVLVWEERIEDVSYEQERQRRPFGTGPRKV